MKPRLVLVRGTHGSGKTTLAHALSTRLGWPVRSRDDIKAAVARQKGVDVLEPASELSRHAVAVFYESIREELTEGHSLIADSTFPRSVCEDDLRPLLVLADARLLHCSVSREVSIERCSGRPGREFVAGLVRDRAEEGWERFESPPDLDIPSKVVDTTDGYWPDLDQLVEWVHA